MPETTDGPTEPHRGPLDGIVVADFTRILAGPYCTMMLADMGATVIKVESPQGDDTRHWKPPARGSDAIYYLSVNRNKKSVTLDLSDRADLEVAMAIIDEADVMVENFRTGSLRKFGLDYETVARNRPDLIYASITGFGPGDGANLLGYDVTIQAISGMMSLTGCADTEPYRMGVALFDVITGLHATMGILGALHHRTKTGEGQHVELNLLTSALSGMANQTATYAAGGIIPTRIGNDHPSIYPYGPFPTADGDLIVAVGNDQQFVRLCRVLGNDSLAHDERFNSSVGRSDNRSELRPLMHRMLSTRSAAEWFDALTDAAVPCGPVLDVRQGLEFAQRLGLEPIVIAGPSVGGIPSIRHPVDYSLTPATYDGMPPALGAANGSVRAWLAGRAVRADECPEE